MEHNPEVLQRALEGARVTVWDWTIETNSILWSKNAEVVLGFPAGSFGNNFESYMKWVHPDDVTPINERVAKALKDQTDYFSEYRVIRPNGEVRWMGTSGKIFRDSSGKPIRIAGTMIDITDRKKMEKRLRATEADLKNIFKIAPGIIAIANANTGYFTKCNPALTRILGFSTEEFLSKPFMEFIHPDDRQRTIDEVEKQLKGSSVVNFENRYLHKDGSYKWLAWHATAADEQGKIYASATDITELKKAEMAKNRITEQLKRATEGAHVALWEGRILSGVDWKSPDTILTMSSIATEMLGYSVDEWKHTVGYWMEKVHPDDQTRVMAALIAHIDKKSADYDIDYRLQHKKGHYIWVHAEGQADWDDNGNVFRVSGAWQDITNRKKAEERLSKLNNCFLSFGPDPKKNIDKIIALCGELLDATAAFYNKIEGNNLYTFGEWNTQYDFERFSDAEGHLCTDVIKQADNRIFTQTNLTDTAYAKTAPCVEKYKLKTYIGNQVRLQDKPIGSLCSVYAKNYIPTEEDKKIIGILASAIGIEEERFAIELQRITIEKLESLGILAGGLAHDFNNLLSIIMGNMNLCAVKESDPALKKLLDETLTATSRAQGLTNQLLTFARGGEPVKTRVALNDELQKIIPFFLAGSGINVRFNLAQDLYDVDVDLNQIAQLIQNLAINAKEAMENSGTLEATTENSKDNNDSQLVKISIKDTGKGIPQSIIPKIFDPYFTTKQSGSGLGLSAVYSIIKQHGGSIDVQSEINKGTIFSIYLPAAKGIKKKEPEPVLPEQKAVNADEKRKRILVVDDEPQMTKLLENLLDFHGYTAVVANDPNSASRLYRKSHEQNICFDAIIIDLTLRGHKSGLELLKELKEFDTDIKAVVSSGYSQDAVMANYKEYGFCAALPKPYNMNTLAETLNKVFL